VGKKAFVILDLASFRHEIADISRRPGQRADLFLNNVYALLEARGYEITGLAVALPLVAVNEMPDVQTKRTRRVTELSLKWSQREANTHLREKRLSFEVLQGGFDGEREVGVDDLIVVRALIEAEAIRSDDKREGEKILILSHDSDLRHLSQFTDGVPTRIVGRRSKFNGRRMKASQVEFEGLSDQEMRFLSSPDAVLPQTSKELLDERADVQPVAAPKIVQSPTVAVVDGYGIACAAASVLSLSELPSAQSVRETLEDLGFRDVNSVQFVLPDVNLNVRPRAGQPGLSGFARKAWTARDSQLDGLAGDLRSDDDPGTEVVRGTLAPAVVPDNARVDPTRRESLRHAKQHSTLITATTVRQWLQAEASEIVVITDVPDVVVALEYLTTKHGHLRPTQIVRMGTRARPIHPQQGGRHYRLPFIVLTERRLAQLTRVSSRGGRELRSAIGVSPVSNGLLHEQWQVVGFEPEVDGLRVRSIVEPRVEMVIMDTSVLELSLDDVVDGKTLDLAIYGNPNMPVDPLIALVGGRQSKLSTRPLVAEVTGRDSDAIHFDLNSDGVPDTKLPVGHDFKPVRAGAKAILGYLHGDAATLRYVAVQDDNAAQPIRDEEMVVVKSAQRDAAVATINGREVVMHSTQQSTLIDLHEGDSVMVIDVGDVNSPHYVVISSNLGDRCSSLPLNRLRLSTLADD